MTTVTNFWKNDIRYKKMKKKMKTKDTLQNYEVKHIYIMPYDMIV